jgi:hypothetical protein
MSLLIFAAVAISTLQFRLDSGPNVQVSYTPAEMSQMDATRVALSISRFVWHDFCEASQQEKCGSKRFYFIDIYLQNRMFRFCSASIAYRGYGDYRSWGNYTCVSKAGDEEFHPVRDTTDVPVFDTKP